MRIDVDGKSFFLCIVSAGRPENVTLMHSQIGNAATWIVPDSMMMDYLRQGARRVITDSGMNVAAARNVGLEEAFAQRLRCLMLDDDLINCRIYEAPNQLRAAEFKEIVRRLSDALDSTDLKLAATTHVTNPLYLKHQVSITAAINGGCLLIKPNRLRFDESIRLSEDVDYAIQHIHTFGGALRSNDLVMRFKRRAAGGVQLYRDENERDKSVQQLIDKWPGIVTRARHDPNHPVMRIRYPRSVLM